MRRHGGSWLPAGKTWQVPSAKLQAALKDLAAAPGLRVEVEDMHPITDKIMQAGRLFLAFARFITCKVAK